MISPGCQSAIRQLAAAGILMAALPTVPSPAADRPVAPPPHIRAVNRDLLVYVREGCRRSTTFRELVARIERSDVVVYLETATFMPPLTKACTRWVGANAALRFVRVAVKIPASTETIIALLGHELQHANEIAAAPEVRNETEFEAFYRRIGDQSPGGWETAAARRAGNMVRDEVVNFVEPRPAPSTTAPATIAQPAFAKAPSRR